MQIPHWQKIDERTAYQGWRSMLVKTFRLPNGQEGNYDIIQNNAYVVVAAFTHAKEVILIRQFRPGPEQVLASFCEGYIDPQESPQAAAARELLEETGYRAGKIEYLQTIRGAYSTEQRICLVATDCVYERPPAGDEDEFLSVQTVPLLVFRQQLRSMDPAFTSLDAAFLALDHLNWL